MTAAAPAGHRRPRARRLAAAAAAALAAAGVVVGFAVTGGPPARQDVLAACTSTVHAEVLVGNGAVSVSYLPPGFHLTSGDPGDIGLGSSGSPVYWDLPGGAGQIQLGPSPASQPLGSNLLGQSPYHYTVTHLTVDGHRGVLLAGAGNPIELNEVAWQVSGETDLYVLGTQLDVAQVEEVARGVRFAVPVLEPLPLSPGRVVSRADAAAAATAGGGGSLVGAKLSSFVEVTDLLRREVGLSTTVISSGDHTFDVTYGAPASLTGAPWEPVWVVLSATPAGAELAFVGAASGRVLWRRPAGDTAWFAALTDRAPGAAGCAGGSSARLPFGVLTRDEETYGWPAPAPAPASGTTVTSFDLTTVREMQAVETGVDCVDLCPPESVEWVTVSVTTAPAGGTVPCPLPEGPGGSGRDEPAVHRYFRFSFGTGGGITCGTPPPWYAGLEDLAPPA